jgi:hypothetical protein
VLKNSAAAAIEAVGSAFRRKENSRMGDPL